MGLSSIESEIQSQLTTMHYMCKINYRNCHASIKKFQLTKGTNNAGNSKADAQSHRNRGSSRHVRRLRWRQSCRVTWNECYNQYASRPWTSHPPNSQWPQLKPSQDFWCLGRWGNRLPVYRKEYSTNLSRVISRPQPGNFGHTREKIVDKGIKLTPLNIRIFWLKTSDLILIQKTWIRLKKSFSSKIEVTQLPTTHIFDFKLNQVVIGKDSLIFYTLIN